MAVLNLRLFRNNQMEYTNYRWEGCSPMTSSNHYDCKDQLVFQNDIIILPFNDIAVVKKGEYRYDQRLLYGWYLEVYSNGYKGSSTEPLDINMLDKCKVIGNIKEDQQLFKRIQEGDIDGIIRKRNTK